MKIIISIVVIISIFGLLLLRKKNRTPTPKTTGRTQYKIQARRFQNDLIRKATDAEITLKNSLDRSGCSDLFEFQKIVWCRGGKKFFIIDFFFPQTGLCVELDGGYHMTDVQKGKDKSRTLELHNLGYIVWRIPNEKIISGSINSSDIIRFNNKILLRKDIS